VVADVEVAVVVAAVLEVAALVDTKVDV